MPNEKAKISRRNFLQCSGAAITAGLVSRPPNQRLTASAESIYAHDGRWDAARSQEWYDEQAWPCGFNYVPSNAISYTEMWMPYNFNEALIDSELKLAESIGFNCIRVVLPFVVWDHDPAAFKRRFDTFLSLCAMHGLRVMPSLFDDCKFGPIEDPVYGRQPEVVKGWYANGWTPSPGHALVRDRSQHGRLEKYVTDMISSFHDDDRVWVWDLYNEPGNGGLRDESIPLLDAVFPWARKASPTQPLTVGIYFAMTRIDSKKMHPINRIAIENSDIVTFHHYGSEPALEKVIDVIASVGRPMICTEWLNRPVASLVETHLPVFAKHNVGCMHWGLVNGNTQTHLHWGWRPEKGQPEIWQHDLFRPDHTAYDEREIGIFKEIIAGKS